MLRNVVVNRGGDVVKYRDIDDETNAAGIFRLRNDGNVRGCLHVSACAAARKKGNANETLIIAFRIEKVSAKDTKQIVVIVDAQTMNDDSERRTPNSLF